MERQGQHAVLALPRSIETLCRVAVPTHPGVSYLAGVSCTCLTGSIAAKIGPTVAEIAEPLTEVPDHQSPAFQRA